MRGFFALLLLEFGLEQLRDGLNSVFLVTAVGNDLDGTVVGGGQCENSHDGFTVYLLPVFFQIDIRGETIRRLYKQSSGPRMDSGPILDGYDLFNHDVPGVLGLAQENRFGALCL